MTARVTAPLHPLEHQAGTAITAFMPTLREHTLSIGQVASRTGLSVAMLRSWEDRHGFPTPERLASGHRRYTVDDAHAIVRVLDLRASGVELTDAIAQRDPPGRSHSESLFAELRTLAPHLSTHPMHASTLLALSHAIEDEYLTRAQRGYVFASFQSRRHFASARARWVELARVASAAVVFADFDDTGGAGASGETDDTDDGFPGAVTRVRLSADSPLRNEWAVICDSPEMAVAVVGWESPGPAADGRGARMFETIWTLEPQVVRQLSLVCADITAAAGHAAAAGLTADLTTAASPSPDLSTATIALVNRFVTYVDAGRADPPSAAPAPPRHR